MNLSFITENVGAGTIQDLIDFIFGFVVKLFTKLFNKEAGIEEDTTAAAAE